METIYQAELLFLQEFHYTVNQSKERGFRCFFANRQNNFMNQVGP